MPALEPEDIFIFRSILQGDLGRLFRSEESAIFPANRHSDSIPKFAAEKAGMASSSNLALKDLSSNFVFLPLNLADEELGVALFKDTSGLYEKYNLLDFWPDLNTLLLEKLRIYKSLVTEAESGLFRKEALPDFLKPFLKASSQGCGLTEMADSAPGLTFVFVELVSSQIRKDQNATHLFDGIFHNLCSDMRESLAGTQYSFMFRMSDSAAGIALPFLPKDMVQTRLVSRVSSLIKRLSTGGVTSESRVGIFCGVVSYKFPVTNETSLEKVCQDITDRAVSVLALAKSRPDYRLACWEEFEKVPGLNVIRGLCSAAGRLNEVWKETETFSLLLLGFDKPPAQKEKELLENRAGRLLPEHSVLISLGQNSYLIYVPEKNVEQIGEIGRKIKDIIRTESENTISVGLAGYPMLKYKKSDVPINAHKALLHTAFFGHDTLTAFDAVSLNISGDMLFNAGHLNGAILEYKKGLLLDDQNANLFNSLGVCYAQLGRYKRAMDYFENALNLDRDNIMAYYNLASAYAKSGLTEKSFSTLEDAIKLKGDSFDILFQMGRLLQEKKRPDEAARYIEKAAECSDAKSFVHRYLGEIYLQLDLKEKAMSEFKKAVKVNPQDAVSLEYLGLLYAEFRGDLELGDTLCSKALELDPRSKSAWKTLGWIYYKKADYPRAIQFTKEAAQRDSRDFEIHYHLGLIYEKMDQIREAKKSWRKALKINPFCKEARQALDSSLQRSVTPQKMS